MMLVQSVASIAVEADVEPRLVDLPAHVGDAASRCSQLACQIVLQES